MIYDHVKYTVPIPALMRTQNYQPLHEDMPVEYRYLFDVVMHDAKTKYVVDTKYRGIPKGGD